MILGRVSAGVTVVIAVLALVGALLVLPQPAAGYDLAVIEPVTIPLWGPTWNHSPVTIRVDVSSGVSQAAVDEVLGAIGDWNQAIATRGGPVAFLYLVPSGAAAEIIVRPKTGGGSVQGQALCQSDANGFFTACKVNVSGKAFGQSSPGGTVRSIALQEIGHALGLLHADNKADVMYGTLQSSPNTQISECDVDGWAAVMAWLLEPPADPHPPTVASVSCGTGGGGAVPDSVTVTTDKFVYTDRETVRIDVTVEGGGAPVAGAAVTVTLTTASGRRLTGSQTTDANGGATLTYKVNAKRDGFGDYTVDAEACGGGTCAQATASTFTVEP